MIVSSFEALYKNAKKIEPVRIAAAGPAKGEVLEALKRVQSEGLAELTFIGDTSWIFKMASSADLNMSRIDLIHEPNLELPAAQVTVEEARKEKAQLLMNGFVSSEHMIQAAMDSKTGIYIKRSFSQLTAIELPGFSKLIFLTDSGIHFNPGAMEKRDILANTLDYLRTLGMEKVRVAILIGTPIVENVKSNTKFKSTYSHSHSHVEDMPLLMDLKEQYPELVLLGPLSLEDSMVGEIPDVFLVPNAEAGQFLSQAITSFNPVKAGHIILGGKVPLVLTANNPTEGDLWRSILMALQLFVPSV
jgi:phosphate butyryltransferase